MTYLSDDEILELRRKCQDAPDWKVCVMDLARLVESAAVQAYKAQQVSAHEDWRSIETAPTEVGSVAIIYAPCLNESGAVGEAFIGKDGLWYWAGAEVGYHDPICDSNSPPTHWVPMPLPPIIKLTHDRCPSHEPVAM